MDWAKQRRDEVIHVVVCAQKTESSILCNRRLWTWQRESGELCVLCGIIYKGGVLSTSMRLVEYYLFAHRSLGNFHVNGCDES